MKDFIKVTWQQIVAGAISIVFIGSLTWVFTQVDKSMEITRLNEKRIQALEVIIESGLKESLDDIEEQLRTTNTRLGTVSSTQKSLELAVQRLNIIIENLGR